MEPEVKVFSDNENELKSAIKLFIRYVLIPKNTSIILYAISDSARDSIRKLWNEISKIDFNEVDLFLIISFQKETQGCLDFLKRILLHWEEWKPCGETSLTAVLKFFLRDKVRANETL